MKKTLIVHVLIIVLIMLGMTTLTIAKKNNTADTETVRNPQDNNTDDGNIVLTTNTIKKDNSRKAHKQKARKKRKQKKDAGFIQMTNIPHTFIDAAAYGNPIDRVFIIINRDIIINSEFEDNYTDYKKELSSRLSQIQKEYTASKGQLSQTMRDRYSETIQQLKKELKNSKGLYLINEINNRIEKQASIDLHLEVSAGELDAQIEDVAAQNDMTINELKRTIRQQGMSYQEFRDEQRLQLLRQKIISAEIYPTMEQPSEKEMREWYNKNIDRLYTPEQYQFRYIYISTRGMKLTEQVKKEKLVNTIITRAEQGSSFIALARKYSDDPQTRRQGGYIPPQTTGFPIYEMFHQNNWKPGKVVSQKDTDGYHLFYFEKITPASQPTYEEARSTMNLQSYVQQSKVTREYNKWLNTRRKKGYIEIIFDATHRYVYQQGIWSDRFGTDAVQYTDEEFFKKFFDSDISIQYES